MHDIVVVSDLHLGRGKNPATGRYARLEAFFYDEDFEHFCRWLCTEAERQGVTVKLVLNGDTFDLLRIEPDPPDPGASARDRRYGPLLDPPHAAHLVAEILAGHPRFVRGLARLLVAGHTVVMTPGNHDQEVQWQPVREVIAGAIAEKARQLAPAAQSVLDRMIFEDWFHYEPGRVWIEHGCQYDVENSFQYYLRGRIVDHPGCSDQLERDLPMGTFFQRYLYNDFGNITFIVPSSRSNLRYFRWLLLNKPRLLARVATGQLPFFFQVLRRLAKSTSNTEVLAQAHRTNMAELAAANELDEALWQIDELKHVRGNAAIVTRGVMLQIGKVVGFGLLVAVLAATLWFTGFYAINTLDSGFTLKALLFLMLNFLLLLTAFAGAGWALLRPPPAPASKPPRRAAQRIAELLAVPIVTFGHSHDELICRLRGPERAAGWYFNTGTWIAVFTHDELLPRERVQYTFLHIRGTTGELLHWSPGREEAVPVVLLEEEERDGARRVDTLVS